MCSERVEYAALNMEAPAEEEAAATTAASAAGGGGAGSAGLPTAEREEVPPSFNHTIRDCVEEHTKDNSDYINLAILSNLKNSGGGSLGDDSSGLGLETSSGSGSAEDFSAAPSSEGGDGEDEDATEKTPLHNAGSRAVTIVSKKPTTAAAAGVASDAEFIRSRRRHEGGGSTRSSSSSGRYSGDLASAEAQQQKGKKKGKGKQSQVPDGGWGWIVVAASFIISMIADGISFSFGLILLQFKHHFEDSLSKTAWIGSLFMSVPLLVGPLGSALVDRYGCRSMTILGGLISAFGFILSSVADSIEMLIVTFGVIAGLGLGLCYVTCVVSIAYWFDKRRAFATGLAAAGTGFGTFAFAPLTQFFISNYGWRGAILMHAGTFLHLCVCGAVMRDPEWWVEEQAKAAKTATVSASGGGAGGSSASNKSQRGSSCGSFGGGGGGTAGGDPAGGGDSAAGLEEARRMLKMGRSPEYVLAALAAASAPAAAGDVPPSGAVANGAAVHACSSSVVNLPTFVRQDETVPLEVLEALSANKRVLNTVLEKWPGLFHTRSLSDQGPLAALPAPPAPPAPATPPPPYPGPREAPPQALPPPPQPAPLKRSLCAVAQPSHYLRGIRVHRNSVMYRGAMLNIHKYRLRASSCPDIFRNSMSTIAQEQEEHWYTDLLNLLRGMTDFSLFAELHFTLMQLSTVLLFIWFIVPYFYLADFMTINERYTDTEAAWLLSIIGITNTIGIVGLGWAGDQPWMNVTKTFAGCLIMCGLSALAMVPCTDNFIALSIVSGLFGFFFASSFSFTPVILVQLIPLENFTTAYGLVLLCQGIGNLIGPPLGGFLFDLTKSWDIAFYLSGVGIVISGILIAAIPVTNNRRMWGTGLTEKEKEKEREKVKEKELEEVSWA